MLSNIVKLNKAAIFTDLDRFYFVTPYEKTGADLKLNIRIPRFINNAVNMDFPIYSY